MPEMELLMLRHVVTFVLLTLCAPAASAICFPYYSECLLTEATFFDGVDDFVLRGRSEILDDSFRMQVFVDPLGNDEPPPQTIYSDASILIDLVKSTVSVSVLVDPSTAVVASGNITIPGGSLVRLELIEIPASDVAPDLVFLGLYIDNFLVDMDLEVGVLEEATGNAYIGAAGGSSNFFRGWIGPLGIAVL